MRIAQAQFFNIFLSWENIIRFITSPEPVQLLNFKMVAILGHLTRIIAGVPVPNTPIVNSAISFAHDNLATSTFNHVMRSWLYGQAIINKLPAANISTVDQEAFAVGAILHDMGL